jgi:P-type conjugative transfer protein TrbJ
LIAAAVLAAVSFPSAGHAQMAVFDAASYGELVQEISQGASEISNLESQLRAQQSMISSLPSSVLGGLSPLVGQTASLVEQLQNVQESSTALISNLNQQYPTSFTGDSPQQLINDLAAAQGQQRQAIYQAQTIQAEIAQNQSAMAAQLNQAESASAGAAGPTQAIQATNQIAGNISAQLTEQNALMGSAISAQEQAALANKSGDAASTQEWNEPQAPLDTGKQF